MSFLLNIYYLYVHIQLHSYPDNIIWFVQLHCALAFLFFLFLFFPVCFVLFLLNIYYLYVYIQLHQLNKFLKYFHNYLTICNVHRPLFFFFSFFHCMLILLVLFLSFLLNIYMCIHSYTDTTHSYNIFTIIELSIF